MKTKKSNKNVVSQRKTLPSKHLLAQSQQRNPKTGYKIRANPAADTPENSLSSLQIANLEHAFASGLLKKFI